MGIKEPKEDSNFTYEEMQVLEQMKKVTYYSNLKKRWYTKLLWQKEPMLQIGTNLYKSRKIANYMTKVKNKDPEKAKLIHEAYMEFVKEGFAELIDPPSVYKGSGTYGFSYIPSHPVFSPHKATTKCRIVLNCSSITETGKSLNDLLPKGPLLLPDYAHVLLRFRMKKYAFAMDISKMFLQIKIDGRDKEYLRYLWITEKGKELHCKFNCLVFGMISSPFQAIYVIKEHAEKFKKEFPLAYKHVKESLYMDDIASCSNDLTEAAQTVDQLVELFKLASMTTHKWVSNSKSVTKSVKKEFLAEDDVVSILGQGWSHSTDNLLFKFTSLNEKDLEGSVDTKRSFLSSIAKLFDPLGYVGPFVICIKLIFQKLWLLTDLKWDDPLPENLQIQWNQIRKQIPFLWDIRIPRYAALSNFDEPCARSLCVFCDASNVAYAACVYLVNGYKNTDLLSSHLIFAKTRVAPMKLGGKKLTPEYTIVRLELLAMVLGAQIATYVKNGLFSSTGHLGMYLFSDSQINLCRLKRGYGSYKQWVANRVKTILDLTKAKDWSHVPTDQNPADLGSRGISDVTDLLKSKLWWDGPEFLKDGTMQSWPRSIKFQNNFDQFKEDGELNIKTFLTLQIIKSNEFIKFLSEKFSSWKKLVTILVYIFRMGLPAHKKYRKLDRSVEEDLEVENYIFRFSQMLKFKSEIEQLQNKEPIDSKSPLKNHSLFIDSDDLLKTITRFDYSHTKEIDEKRPIVLPHHCRFVELFILHLHEKYFHAGPNFLLGYLNKKFYLVHGRKEIKRILLKCFQKSCLKILPMQQQMAPLPASRIDDPTCYRVVACDLFGPLNIKRFENSQKTFSKVWGCVFTCLHSRGVHLELLNSQSTEAFLDAFRKFSARKGLPSIIYSDNGTNFKAAEKELKALFKSVNWKTVQDSARKRGVQWIFSTPASPWKTGAVERMVQSVKKPLKSMANGNLMTFQQLEVILIEIEAVINNRPLGEVSQTSVRVITPAELNLGRTLDVLPMPKKAPNMKYNVQWKKRKALLNKFWNLWQHNYLNQLKIRGKWPEPKELDILHKLVILNHKAHFNEWIYGRIIRILPVGQDKLIRNVEVLTSKGSYIRPIQDLSLIENYCI